MEVATKDLFYIPTNLQRARDQIVVDHQLDLNQEDLSKNSWLEIMVRHIATVDGARYQRFMNKLTERDISLLAQYLPHNYFKSEIGDKGYERVAAAVESRSTVKVMKDLLIEWQMEYDRPECNQVLTVYAKRDPNMHKVLNEGHFGRLFLYLLSKDNIPNSLGRILVRDERIAGKTFEEKFTGLGLSDELPLYHALEKRYYTFCQKEEYLKMGEEELLDQVRGYREDLLKVFVKNFLTEVTKREEQDWFPKVAAYLVNRLEGIRSERFHAFFEGETPEIQKSFMDWAQRNGAV